MKFLFLLAFGIAASIGMVGTAEASVQVTTDRAVYGSSDTATVTVTNLGPGYIMPRGGLVCDTYWPIRFEQQGVNGWAAVLIPRNAICAGVSAGLIPVGSSLVKSYTAGSFGSGTFRAAFLYDVPGGMYGTLPPAYSSAYVVQ